MNAVEPVEVFTTSIPPQAEIIRMMLDAEGIEADVTGDSQGGFPGAIPEIAIMVHGNDAERARRLIESHQSTAAAEDE